jgi:hypothetical protein
LPCQVYVLVEIKHTEAAKGYYYKVRALLEDSELITANFISKLTPKEPKQKASNKPRLSFSNMNNKSLTIKEKNERFTTNAEASSFNGLNEFITDFENVKDAKELRRKSLPADKKTRSIKK